MARTRINNKQLEIATDLVPASANGAALGSTSAEWADLYLSDGGVIYLGADQDVSLTHVADEGLLLNSTRELQFNSADSNISAPGTGRLDLSGSAGLKFSAGQTSGVCFNFHSDFSAPAAKFYKGSSPGLVFKWGSGGVASIECGTASEDMVFKDSNGNEMLKLDEGDNLAIFEDSIKLGTNGRIKDSGGNNRFAATSGGNLQLIDSGGSNGVILSTSALDFTSHHITMADSKNLKLGTGSDLQLYHDGTNSYITNAEGALKIATETSGIAVTIGHSTSEVTVADNLNITGRLLVDDATEATSTTDGSLQTDGGLSVVKDIIAGDDVFLLSDSAVLGLGAGKDVTITHDGGTGATLASAGAFILDGAGAVTVDSDAALVVGGASIDMDADGGAVAIDGTGGVNLGTATSGVAISIGHSTSETTVNDNLVVTGDLTVNGATVTVSASNMLVEDPLIKLNKGQTASPSLDQGLVISRGNGSAADKANKAMLWDESADTFAFIACDEEDASTSGNVTISGYAPLRVAALTAAAITASGRLITDDTTEATSTTDGALQTDGGLSVAKDIIAGDDVFLLSDSAVLGLGAGKDVTITHDGGTGATLASAGAFVVDGAAAVTVDSDAALTIGGATIDMDADGGAVAIDGTGGLNLATATSGVAVSIGHSTSETTVNDNLSVTGDAAVAGTLSMAGDLVHTGDVNNKIAFGTDTQSFETGGTARMNLSDSGLQVGTGARVTTILDEDGMGTDSATALATQQSIKAYVDAQLTGQDMDITSDSGTIDVDLDSETLTIAGGDGVSTSASGTTVTIAIKPIVQRVTKAELHASVPSGDFSVIQVSGSSAEDPISAAGVMVFHNGQLLDSSDATNDDGAVGILNSGDAYFTASTNLYSEMEANDVLTFHFIAK